jgi:hypothetical protein
MPPMSNAEYHASEGLSNSQLSDFAKSPVLYRGLHVSKQIKKNEPTIEMIIGTALHEVLLEDGPQSFIPLDRKLDLRTKADKEYLAEFTNNPANEGKDLLALDHWETVQRMRDAVMEHNAAKDLLFTSNGENEIGYQMIDEDGIMRRCKFDRIVNRSHIVDVKTCQDASPAAFARTVVDREYHRQAAWYSEILVNAKQLEFYPNFFFVAVTKEVPVRVEVYSLSQEFLDVGFSRVIRLMQDYRQCLSSGVWQFKHYGKPLTLPVPRYAKYQSEFEV